MKKIIFFSLLALCLVVFFNSCSGGGESIKEYTITLKINPSQGGTASGEGRFLSGQLATVTAQAKSAYRFKNWTEGQEIVSTNKEYSFIVTKNRTLQANFEPTGSTDGYIITLLASPGNAGTVTGGGLYVNGEEATIKARANSGFSFKNWTENEQLVSDSSEYSFIVTKNITLQANFEADNGTGGFTVTLTANPEEGGSVHGGGYFPDIDAGYISGMANYGWKFDNWTEDGQIISTESNCLLIVTRDRDIVGNFSLREDLPDECTLTLTANPEEGGVVRGAGLFDRGTITNISAIANLGYIFDNWTMDGEEFSREPDRNVLLNKHMNLVANFIQPEYTAPAGYNKNDYIKAVTFLEMAHKGQKNGERLSNVYDPEDPMTWGQLNIQWTDDTNKRLKKINLHYQDLYGPLDLSGCNSLEILEVSYNPLHHLDLSGCTSLRRLGCGECKLQTLILANCPALENIYCAENQLSELILDDLAQLERLECQQNQLRELDLSGCPLLSRLYCYENLLTELDLSVCPKMEAFDCSRNKITNLNYHACDLLYMLYCSSNKLTNLQIQNFVYMEWVRCDGNNLSSLKIGDCPRLSHVYCEDNLLTFSNLPLLDINIYEYIPQREIPIGINGEIKVNKEIDLSEEANIIGVKTTFTWFKENGEKVFPTSPSPGVFIFDNSFIGSTLYCTLSNSVFYDLELTTTKVLCVW